MEGTPAICHIDINLYYTPLKIFPKSPSKNLMSTWKQSSDTGGSY